MASRRSVNLFLPGRLFLETVGTCSGEMMDQFVVDRLRECLVDRVTTDTDLD